MEKEKAQPGKMITYKALDKTFKCRDFQFEVGESYHEDDVRICERGFHTCKNPFNILNDYDLTNCRFAQCEVWGKMETHNEDSKVASSDIKILRELTLPEFISLVHDYMYNDCKEKDEGDYSKLASSGDFSKLASSGDSSQLASSGYFSKLASSGNSSKLASSGYSSKLASSGDSSQLASSGDYSKLAASGNSSKLASSGYFSKLASSGNSSKLDITGNDSVGANIGYRGKIKGVKGTWITLAEYDNNGKCKMVKSDIIDGETLKENTWYQLINGKFTEVQP